MNQPNRYQSGVLHRIEQLRENVPRPNPYHTLTFMLGAAHVSGHGLTYEAVMLLEARARLHEQRLQCHEIPYQDGDDLNGSVVVGKKIALYENETQFDTDRGMA